MSVEVSSVIGLLFSVVGAAILQVYVRGFWLVEECRESLGEVFFSPVKANAPQCLMNSASAAEFWGLPVRGVCVVALLAVFRIGRML